MKSIIILDQVADKFYQEVIDAENYNSTLNDTMQLAGDIVDKVTQQIFIVDSFEDLKGNPEIPIFHVDTVQETMYKTLSSFLFLQLLHFVSLLISDTE